MSNLHLPWKVFDFCFIPFYFLFLKQHHWRRGSEPRAEGWARAREEDGQQCSRTPEGSRHQRGLQGAGPHVPAALEKWEAPDETPHPPSGCGRHPQLGAASQRSVLQRRCSKLHASAASHQNSRDFLFIFYTGVIPHELRHTLTQSVQVTMIFSSKSWNVHTPCTGI